jgi:DNA-binding SARP family transcriptional activator/TolB-like protein
MIRLSVLGTVELRRADGTEVGSVTAQPKRLALLAYLAAARPRGFHRRDTLVGLFWPESTDERARSALGQALYFLRRSLGPDVIVGRGADEVGIAADRLWCDAAAIHDALDAGQVEEALELYRGDLLPGLHVPGARGFEEWLDRERSLLRRAVLDAASTRARELESAEPDAAANMLRRALDAAPEDEALLRRLMTLLDAHGDRAGALAVFDEFARRLASEFEIEPSPETLALRASITARTAPLDPESAQRMAPPATPRPTARQLAPVPPSSDVAAAPAAADAPAHEARSAHPRPGLTGRVTWSRAATVIVLIVAAAATAGLWPRGRLADAPGRSDAFTLAVVPFTTATADSALERIARELVVPLSANLDGLGDVRAVEGIDVLAAAGTAEASAAALDLAGRLGASRVLYGAIVAAGDGLRVEATMRNVADGSTILRASVASARDVSALADSLTWAVLHELWRDRAAAADSGIAPPVPAEPALATRSLPALRAFWEGERATSQDRWRDAAEHFARAIALDSTWWFAYWRYGYARSTVEAEVPTGIREAYESHRFEFPDRDRLLIEARMADSLSERLDRHRALTRAYPAYWHAWWDYANRLVHDGPLLGTTLEDARAALEQTLALRPNDVIVLQHLFWVAAAEHDVRTMEMVVARTRALRARSTDFQPPVPDYLGLFEMVLAAAGEDQAALDRAIDANVEHLIRHVRGAAGDRFSLGVASFGYHAAELAFARRMLQSEASPELKGAQRRALALTWAARGDWDAAMAAAREYAAAVDGPAPVQHMLRLAVTGEWLGALPAGAADAWRAQLGPSEQRLEPLHVAELAWLDGVLAAARGDLDALMAARLRLRTAGSTADVPAAERAVPLALPPPSPDPDVASVQRILGASLTAFELAARGDPARAGEALAELERQRAEFGWSKAPAQWHPYLTGLNRLAAARWLRASGQPGPAGQLLTWTEAVEVPAHLAEEAGTLLAATAYYERALAAEALGRSDEARRHFNRFLRRYDAPTPTQPQLVDRARRYLAR